MLSRSLRSACDAAFAALGLVYNWRCLGLLAAGVGRNSRTAGEVEPLANRGDRLRRPSRGASTSVIKQKKPEALVGQAARAACFAAGLAAAHRWARRSAGAWLQVAEGDSAFGQVVKGDISTVTLSPAMILMRCLRILPPV